jgi:hypothetical protein
MTFMNDRGQREADEFAERMQRELEAARSPESRDEMSDDPAARAWAYYLALAIQKQHELPVVKPMRDTWSDIDTGFHPKHTFGRK